MMGARPGRGDLAANDGGEAAAHHGRSHVHVDDEEPDGRQGRGDVQQDGGVAQAAQAPRDFLGEPQDGAGEKQHGGSIKH